MLCVIRLPSLWWRLLSEQCRGVIGFTGEVKSCVCNLSLAQILAHWLLDLNWNHPVSPEWLISNGNSSVPAKKGWTSRIFFSFISFNCLTPTKQPPYMVPKVPQISQEEWLFFFCLKLRMMAKDELGSCSEFRTKWTFPNQQQTKQGEHTQNVASPLKS